MTFGDLIGIARECKGLICLDFETFYSDDYTLRKMTQEAYLRDPRFSALCLGIRLPDGRLGCLEPQQIAPWLSTIDWNKTGVVCHHAQFDAAILSWHYGVRPAFICDTLSMGRQVLGNHLSLALESLAKHYGLAAKSVPYDLFKGRQWRELDERTRALMKDGCVHDVELTWSVFQELGKTFPLEEYPVVDMTVRMFTEPVLVGDVEMLGKVWMDEAKRKKDLLAEVGIDPAELQSADKFAALLREQGVEPETKPGKNGQIYAFAKTDDFMKDMLDGPDPYISALAAARLGLKSTIDQTRAERLGEASQRGPIPVYLRYCGAHTTRWSGGDAVNFQNLRRGSDLRRALVASPGHKLAVVDLSQIEARVLATVAGQHDLVEMFAADADPYSDIATKFYGRPVTRADKAERQLGKTLILGCGYGMGWSKFQVTCRRGPLGGAPIVLSDEEAQAAVNTYRNANKATTAYWGAAGRMIARLAGGPETEWGPMVVRDGRIYGPNGSWLDYTTLEYDGEEQAWRVRTRKGWSKLYGGKLVENVVQWLARIVMSQAMLRIRAHGHKIVTTTHDEIVVLVKADGNEYDVLQWLIDEMRRPVPWLPGLPLDAEGSVEERYSK